MQEKKGIVDLHEKKKIKRTRQQKKKTKEPRTKNASSSQGKDSDEVAAIDVTSDADSDEKSSSDGEESGTEEDASLKLEDICALCGSAWVYGSSLDQTTSCPLQEVMILCDGCDGSYHALCVGNGKWTCCYPFSRKLVFIVLYVDTFRSGQGAGGRLVLPMVHEFMFLAQVSSYMLVLKTKSVLDN